jgi:hypothetical protein
MHESQPFSSGLSGLQLWLKVDATINIAKIKTGKTKDLIDCILKRFYNVDCINCNLVALIIGILKN